MSYTKVHQSIVTSSIWVESPEVFKAWMTFLVMPDERGVVIGTIPGLANIAGLPVETFRAAVDKFCSPDPDSRTNTDDGRRLRKVDGGWLLINYEKYRMDDTAIRMEKDRLRKKRARDRAAAKSAPSAECPVASADVRGNVRQAEGEAEVEVEEKKKERTPQERLALEWMAEWKVPPTRLDRWLEALQTLEKQHGWSAIEKMVAWVRQDDFWARNCRSPLKLLKRDDEGVLYWDRLSVEMAKPRKGKKPGAGEPLFQEYDPDGGRGGAR